MEGLLQTVHSLEVKRANAQECNPARNQLIQCNKRFALRNASSAREQQQREGGFFGKKRYTCIVPVQQINIDFSVDTVRFDTKNCCKWKQYDNGCDFD